MEPGRILKSHACSAGVAQLRSRFLTLSTLCFEKKVVLTFSWFPVGLTRGITCTAGPGLLPLGHPNFKSPYDGTDGFGCATGPFRWGRFL